MPTEFWNWDTKSQENILKWSQKIDGITSKVIGQPYLSYWQSKNKVIKGKTKVMLYSMQTTPLDLFSEKLVHLIRHSDYKWILRLHPRDTTGLSEINHFLEQNNIHLKTIVQDAFREPLPKVLSNVFMHVTNYSGCLIEAQMMGTPTVLIDKIGLEIYESYID